MDTVNMAGPNESIRVRGQKRSMIWKQSETNIPCKSEI
jgi:hypothetical protein